MTASEHTVESTHTPGPWEYVPSTDKHGAYVTSDHGTICDAYYMVKGEPVPFQRGVDDANARLIACAPDLLTTLRMVASLLDRLSETDYPVSDEAAEVIRVLAKAEGRS